MIVNDLTLTTIVYEIRPMSALRGYACMYVWNIYVRAENLTAYRLLRRRNGNVSLCCTEHNGFWLRAELSQ